MDGFLCCVTSEIFTPQDELRVRALYFSARFLVFKCSTTNFIHIVIFSTILTMPRGYTLVCIVRTPPDFGARPSTWHFVFPPSLRLPSEITKSDRIEVLSQQLFCYLLKSHLCKAYCCKSDPVRYLCFRGLHLHCLPPP